MDWYIGTRNKKLIRL